MRTLDCFEKRPRWDTQIEVEDELRCNPGQSCQRHNRPRIIQYNRSLYVQVIIYWGFYYPFVYKAKPACHIRMFLFQQLDSKHYLLLMTIN